MRKKENIRKKLRTKKCPSVKDLEWKKYPSRNTHNKKKYPRVKDSERKKTFYRTTKYTDELNEDDNLMMPHRFLVSTLTSRIVASVGLVFSVPTKASGCHGWGALASNLKFNNCSQQNSTIVMRISSVNLDLVKTLII